MPSWHVIVLFYSFFISPMEKPVPTHKNSRFHPLKSSLQWAFEHLSAKIEREVRPCAEQEGFN